MKRRIMLLITLLCFSHVLLMAKSDVNDDPVNSPNWRRINFGIKAGFNSSMFIVSKFKIRDVTIHDFQNNYQLGYLGSCFMRFNFKKNFIQPEISYNISKSEISFDKLGTQHPDIEPDYATLRSTVHSFDLPVLYGYNIVKSGPYGMSLFGGPKNRYLWSRKNKITFDNFDFNDLEEDLYPFNLSITVGIAVNISRIFFDFRYEQDLHNISKNVTYEANPNNGTGAVSYLKLKRREQTLSFSLGMLF